MLVKIQEQLILANFFYILTRKKLVGHQFDRFHLFKQLRLVTKRIICRDFSYFYIAFHGNRCSLFAVVPDLKVTTVRKVMEC